MTRSDTFAGTRTPMSFRKLLDGRETARDFAMSNAMDRTAAAIDRAASTGRMSDIRRATQIGSDSAYWATGGRHYGSYWDRVWGRGNW